MEEKIRKDDPLVPVTIRKPESVRNRLNAVTALKGTSVQQVIGDFVDAYLEGKLQNFNRTNPEIMGPIVREEPYNPEQWLVIAGELLNHPKPGIASTLRGVLVQLQDAARFWDGLQGTKASTAGEDQPGGNDGSSGGLGALDRDTDEIEQELKKPLRSGKEAHEKKRRDREENSGGR